MKYKTKHQFEQEQKQEQELKMQELSKQLQGQVNIPIEKDPYLNTRLQVTFEGFCLQKDIYSGIKQLEVYEEVREFAEDMRFTISSISFDSYRKDENPTACDSPTQIGESYGHR